MCREVYLNEDDPNVARLFKLQVTNDEIRRLSELRERSGPFRLRRRLSIARNLDQLRNDAADDKRKVAESGVLDSIARSIVDSILRSERESTRHLYHRELLVDLEQVAARVAEIAQAAKLSRGGVYDFYSVRMNLSVSDLPDIAELLTEQSIREIIKRRVEHYARIAADSEMLTATAPREERGKDGRILDPILYVQHKASGLRAYFTPGDPASDYGGMFGQVYSKPYRIGSLDPSRPGVSADWNSFVGLGIGRKIYLTGARILPAERWLTSAASEQAAGLRRRLHAMDPVPLGKRVRVCVVRHSQNRLAGS